MYLGTSIGILFQIQLLSPRSSLNTFVFFTDNLSYFDTQDKLSNFEADGESDGFLNPPLAYAFRLFRLHRPVII